MFVTSRVHCRGFPCLRSTLECVYSDDIAIVHTARGKVLDEWTVSSHGKDCTVCEGYLVREALMHSRGTFSDANQYR